YYPRLPGILRLAGPDAAGNLRWNPDMDLTALNHLETPVGTNFSYPENMTVVAAVGEGFAVEPGDRIQAYTGNEIRGEARPLMMPGATTPAFFFNISGQGERPLYFVVSRDGKKVAQTDFVMDYRSNAMVGDLRHPFMLNFGSAVTGIKAFPNPFTEEITIRVSLPPGTHQVQLSVYDVSGHLVKAFPGETTKDNLYQAIWNGRNSSETISPMGTYFIRMSVDGRPGTLKIIKF
ncbi:MAG TPA: T9SS type A sorting domain-containing protein, partial [Chitinophagaceae bacterium]